MKALRYLILSAAALALTAVDAVAQTWICDSEKIAGFDNARGYQVQTWPNRSSYRIKVDVERSKLSFEADKIAFDRMVDTGFAQPASIAEVGYSSYISLCEIWTDVGSKIYCDGATRSRGDFRFNLDTGLFSMVATGFEDGNGYQSWVEVGECRRVN